MSSRPHFALFCILALLARSTVLSSSPAATSCSARRPWSSRSPCWRSWESGARATSNGPRAPTSSPSPLSPRSSSGPDVRALVHGARPLVGGVRRRRTSSGGHGGARPPSRRAAAAAPGGPRIRAARRAHRRVGLPGQERSRRGDTRPQSSPGSGRRSATWNVLAGMIVMAVPVFLVTASRKGVSPLARGLAASILVLLLLTFFFTFSRGGFVAVAVELLVFFALTTRRLSASCRSSSPSRSRPRCSSVCAASVRSLRPRSTTSARLAGRALTISSLIALTVALRRRPASLCANVVTTPRTLRAPIGRASS